MASEAFLKRLKAAQAADELEGSHRRSDALICGLLQRVADKARGTLAKSMTASPVRQKAAPAKLLIKASVTASKPLIKKPKPARRTWSRAEVESALNDGVARGLVSGTAAMAAMKAITPP